MGGVLDKVRATIDQHHMMDAGMKVGVAVSGGIDSVVLLDVLIRIVPQLQVLHLNHQLRGALSDADEEFVRALAATYGASFHVATAKLASGNTEQEGRKARHAMFERLRGNGT